MTRKYLLLSFPHSLFTSFYFYFRSGCISWPRVTIALEFGFEPGSGISWRVLAIRSTALRIHFIWIWYEVLVNLIISIFMLRTYRRQLWQSYYPSWHECCYSLRCYNLTIYNHQVKYKYVPHVKWLKLATTRMVSPCVDMIFFLFIIFTILNLLT